jgi:hypothetical protein
LITRVKDDTYRGIDIDVYLTQGDLPIVVGIHARSYGNLSRHLYRSSIAFAGALEDIHGQICFRFFEAVAAPLAQGAIFVEESNRFPLSIAGHEIGATDRFSHLKYAPKILLAEYAEDLVQLLEEFRAKGAFIRRRQLTLALRK